MNKDRKDKKAKKPSLTDRDIVEQARDIMRSRDVSSLDQVEIPEELRDRLRDAGAGDLEDLEKELGLDGQLIKEPVQGSAVREAVGLDRREGPVHGVGPEEKKEPAFEPVDGSCTVKVSEDRMSAQISLYPSQHNGKPLAFSDVKSVLDTAGVVYGINEDLLKKLIMTVEKTGEEKEDVVIARGTSPEEGKDGAIHYHFGDDESLLKDTVTGEGHPNGVPG
jgi:hypothetical protein